MLKIWLITKQKAQYNFEPAFSETNPEYQKINSEINFSYTYIIMIM